MSSLSALEQREARAHAAANGLCTQCFKRDAFLNSRRCVECRATARAADARRTGRFRKSNRCGNCGEFGHKRSTCL